MSIDWFTVIAQVLNFLILVWLLKHFLYKPIINAINSREERIATELKNADIKKAEAKKESDDFRQKNLEFDQIRDNLLNKATEDANSERQRLLDEARKDVVTLAAKQNEGLRSEARNLRQALNHQTQHEVFAIIRKAMKDLADDILEDRVIDLFSRRLHELSGDGKEQLSAALRAEPSASVLRSAFELSASRRASIEKTIKETLNLETNLRFETSPDLIGGIELTANGNKISWNIADYLNSMEAEVAGLLKTQVKPENEPGAQAGPRSDPKKKNEAQYGT